jgi:transketolase
MTDASPTATRMAERYRQVSQHFEAWETTKDLVDNLIDVVLNYRQSGHPGGSRSKVHVLVATLLSGAMRWDIRHPEKRFGDRFVLVGGHTVPLIYCTLTVLNEAMRIKYQQTGDRRYCIATPRDRTLFWEDLLLFRRRDGLAGHAEMGGKTLFLKFNTGPSGHGGPAAAGMALALKRAAAEDVRVFAFEGEGGLTTGATYETMNSAWGLALDNLYFVVDWNNFGIDEHPVSSVVYGSPADWFAAHGWRVFGTERGSEWEPVAAALLDMVLSENPQRAPNMLWVKTRKGREYLKYDNASHGVPHPMNSELFWQTKRPFVDKYDAQFVNFGGQAPADPAAVRAEFKANLQAVMSVLARDQRLVDYLADTLADLGEQVPDHIPGFRLSNRKPIPAGTRLPESTELTARSTRTAGGTPFQDERLFDYRSYPADLYVAPGTLIANRMALAKWGAWVNALGAQEYGRPVFLACSADLADSTNISGFAKAYGSFPGYGWYERWGNSEGVLLPQEITEFTNAGILAGMVSVNLSQSPETEFDGFWGTCSTYASFSYLKYGLMRLFSQLAQDCPLKVGKILWIASHSGPETADDSRTHFGVFAPGVTQLFPAGHVINLHPWEHNEVPIVLGAALREPEPIVALHLTRPPIPIPDRTRLGMPSHFEAARGAYVVRAGRCDEPHGGTLVVQGTSAMASVVNLLPELDRQGLNVKVVCATSPQLFARQPAAYCEQVLSAGDRMDSTVITTQARWLMHDWLFNPLAEEYAMSSDWDNRWRTGGTLDDVIDEAHLSPRWLLAGIRRFVDDRQARLGRLQAGLDAARG